jgi:site-specific recombinase XerD
MAFFDYIESFTGYLLSQRGYSEHTVRNYRIDLGQFYEFLADKFEGSESESVQELEKIDFSLIIPLRIFQLPSWVSISLHIFQ